MTGVEGGDFLRGRQLTGVVEGGGCYGSAGFLLVARGFQVLVHGSGYKYSCFLSHCIIPWLPHIQSLCQIFGAMCPSLMPPMTNMPPGWRGSSHRSLSLLVKFSRPSCPLRLYWGTTCCLWGRPFLSLFSIRAWGCVSLYWSTCRGLPCNRCLAKVQSIVFPLEDNSSSWPSHFGSSLSGLSSRRGLILEQFHSFDD